MDAPLPRMRVAVLGAGSWGTALAALASGQADTCLWARDPDTARALQRQRRNPRYLPDIPLPDTLHATHDFDRAVAHAVGDGATPGLIILGVPVAGMTDACQRLARCLDGRPRPALGVIWTCKGFHPDSGQLPHEIAADILQELPGAGLGVLSGPSFAREVAQGLPVALTVASTLTPAAEATVSALHGGNARIYTSCDIKGVEVGGALKNVMAIACGISDGLRLGDNARAALITRGLAEIQRLGLALGGQADTFSGLTGLGDLVLTATGNQSRNRQVGLAVGEGRRLGDILADGMTAEGVRCARAVLAMGRRLDVDLPITQAVCDVLFGGLAPQEAVAALLSRESRPER